MVHLQPKGDIYMFIVYGLCKKVNLFTTQPQKTWEVHSSPHRTTRTLHFHESGVTCSYKYLQFYTSPYFNNCGKNGRNGLFSLLTIMVCHRLLHNLVTAMFRFVSMKSSLCWISLITWGIFVDLQLCLITFWLYLLVLLVAAGWLRQVRPL